MARDRPIPPAPVVGDGEGDHRKPLGVVLDEMARELELLDLSRLNPHVYHERRELLIKRMRRLAGRQRALASTPGPDTTTYHAPGKPLGPQRAAAATEVFRRR